jgi:hypothetical protein
MGGMDDAMVCQRINRPCGKQSRTAPWRRPQGGSAPKARLENLIEANSADHAWQRKVVLSSDGWCATVVRPLKRDSRGPGSLMSPY